MDTLLEFLKEKRKEGPLPSDWATLAYMLEHRNGTSEREIIERQLVKVKARLNGYTPEPSLPWCEYSYIKGQLDLLQLQAERVEEILKEAGQQKQVENMLKQGSDE